MAISEEAVREALKQVVDPELFVNIVDLGLVYLVELQEAGEQDRRQDRDDDDQPGLPGRPAVDLASQERCVGAMEGVGNVEVKLVMIPPWTPDRMTEEARDQLGIF